MGVEKVICVQAPKSGGSSPIYLRHKTLKKRRAHLVPNQSEHPLWALLKTMALFQELLKGLVLGSDRNRFADSI